MRFKVYLLRRRGRRLPWREAQNGRTYIGRLITRLEQHNGEQYSVLRLEPNDPMSTDCPPALYEPVLLGFEVHNWIGLFAPAGTAPDIVRRWNGEVMRIMQSPDIQARLPNEGARFSLNTPEQFGAFVKSEIAKWAPVVKASGARVD